MNEGSVPPVPRPIRVLVAVLSGLVLASAMLGAVLALAGNDRPAWTLMGFELVIAITCVFGVLAGAGFYREAPGLSLACVAGTIFAGSVLGYLSLNPRVLAGVGLTPFLGLRAGAAAIIAAAGAICVLSRHPRSLRLAGTGVLVALPVLAAAGIVAVPRLRGALAPLAGLDLLAQMGIAVAAFLVLGACVCASADLIIRAFELGRPEHWQRSSPPAPGAKP